MLQKKDPSIIGRIEKILNQSNTYKVGSLFHVAGYILKRKKEIEKLTSSYKTPFYIFDRSALDKSIDCFLDAFKKEVPSFKAYYAMKINHHPSIVERAVKKGMGIDVGSIRELEMAIGAGSSDITYFSPGKTNDDIIHALKYSDFLRINVDSFSELKKIGILAKKYKKNIRVGIRIHIDKHGSWKKYGIHLKDLKNFWKESRKYSNVKLSGIHFHSSRNKDATLYEATIEELGRYIKRHFTKKELEAIKYVDFGGGFEVYNSEGIYPQNTPLGSIIKTTNACYNLETEFKDGYYIRDAIKIEEYALKIGNSIKKNLQPILPNASYYSEPGRFICNSAMHIALSIVDVKNRENIILDGGVNMVGWQRFEHEYFPLINLTHPSKKEIRCNMWGSLCTTWDIWGYYCYSKQFREGDVIIVPNQGTLSYSLAQNFIQPIPPVYNL